MKLSVPYKKILRHLGMALFSVFGVLIYFAYYLGLVALFGSMVGNAILVPALCLTYMFRMDVIAASGAFYGAWQVWQLPMEDALIVSALYVVVSIYMNNDLETMAKGFIKRVSTPEQPVDVVAEEQKKTPV